MRLKERRSIQRRNNTGKASVTEVHTSENSGELMQPREGKSWIFREKHIMGTTVSHTKYLWNLSNGLWEIMWGLRKL